ncbi:MAG: hypothetical protein AAFX87_03505 [Bacteroidota bacterium]
MITKVAKVSILILLAGVAIFCSLLFYLVLVDISIADAPESLIFVGLAVLAVLSFILRVRSTKSAQSLQESDIIDDLHLDGEGNRKNTFLKVCYLVLGIIIMAAGLFGLYRLITNPVSEDDEEKWVIYITVAGLLGSGGIFILDWMKIK